LAEQGGQARSNDKFVSRNKIKIQEGVGDICIAASFRETGEEFA
jgi:hypothetical protein